MDTIAPDGKPQQLASHSAPPPQGVPRLPPSEGSHGLAPPRGAFDAGWRPFHSYEGANPDQRGPPHPHPVAGPHAYTGPPRDSPPGPHDAPFGRPGSISGHSGSPTDVHPPPPAYRPMNGSSHEGVPGLHSASGDFRPRLGYAPSEGQPNGEAPHGMPMLSHPDPMQPSPASHPPGQYPSGNPVSHTPGQYDAGSYFISPGGGPLGQRQRRTTRAQQACDQCRARKAKCDEGRPACSHCKESNVQCVYKDVPPHKHERATQLLLERLQQIDDRLDELHRIDDLIKLQSAQNTKLDTLLAQKGVQPAHHHSVIKSDAKSVASNVSPDAFEPSEHRKGPKESEFPLQKMESGERSYQDAKNESADLDDGGLSIPIEHTTAAHKLLLWPSIQKLLPEKIDDDYVMELEQLRGPIRPYGRGEGDDRSDSSRHPSSPMTNSPSSRDDDETQSPSPGNVWGTGFGFHPGADGSKLALDRQVGGLNAYGALNTESETIQMHLQSYIRHMHILHPFLEQKSLKNMINIFIRNYSTRTKKPFIPPFPQTSGGDPAAGLQRVPKRKRSVETPFSVATEVESSQSPTYGMGSAPMIQRSIENAIVLLVLALGAICAWKKEIPGPVQDAMRRHSSSAFGPLPGFSPELSDSGMQTSPTFQSPTDTSFLPLTGENRRRLSGMSHPGGIWSSHEAPDQPPRNMDIIPGMAYYAYASDILGNLQGGNDLPYAQACLLAALYAGQLAHPFASHGWISQASRACQVLVRPRKYDTLPDGFRKDLISFAFWTCLQLESDILAELDLPASGISRLEGRMNFPKGVFAHSIPNEIHNPSTMMMLYYSAQIHLRKVLNRVHTDLYKAEKHNSKERRTTWSTKVQEALSFNLEQWRSGLPVIMKWTDGDALPRDINIARMRAKYYGARYIIHRPLLHHALHPMAPKPSNPAPVASPALSVVSSSQSQISPSMAHIQQADAVERWSSDMGPPGRSLSLSEQQPLSIKELEPKVLEACMICIDAAYNSTVAFDGVEGRPIITNIFGTAHAQFGNMLVLSATYTSHLSALVDREKLRTLLDRTIKFLLQSRHISPTLYKDAEILTMIRHKIFDQPATSFSSNDG